MPMRSALEDAFDGVALLERHNRFLPVRTAASRLANATQLAALVRRPDSGDLHPEQLLDRLADCRLRRVWRNLEHVLTPVLTGDGRLLGHDRTDDGAMQSGHDLCVLLLGRSFLRRALRSGTLL